MSVICPLFPSHQILSLQGKIESETWAGLSKSYEILKETLENNNNTTDQRENTLRAVKEETTDSKVSRLEQDDRVGDSPTRISLYPENYQVNKSCQDDRIIQVIFCLVHWSAHPHGHPPHPHHAGHLPLQASQHSGEDWAEVVQYWAYLSDEVASTQCEESNKENRTDRWIDG